MLQHEIRPTAPSFSIYTYITSLCAFSSSFLDVKYFSVSFSIQAGFCGALSFTPDRHPYSFLFWIFLLRNLTCLLSNCMKFVKPPWRTVIFYFLRINTFCSCQSHLTTSKLSALSFKAQKCFTSKMHYSSSILNFPIDNNTSANITMFFMYFKKSSFFVKNLLHFHFRAAILWMDHNTKQHCQYILYESRWFGNEAIAYRNCYPHCYSFSHHILAPSYLQLYQFRAFTVQTCVQITYYKQTALYNRWKIPPGSDAFNSGSMTRILSMCSIKHRPVPGKLRILRKLQFFHL